MAVAGTIVVELASEHPGNAPQQQKPTATPPIVPIWSFSRDDVVRHILRHDSSADFQRAAATGIDPAAVRGRGVLRDDGSSECERALVEDTASLARGVLVDGAVANKQRDLVGSFAVLDAAAEGGGVLGDCAIGDREDALDQV